MSKYFCNKCKRNHTKNSQIGKKHSFLTINNPSLFSEEESPEFYIQKIKEIYYDDTYKFRDFLVQFISNHLNKIEINLPILDYSEIRFQYKPKGEKVWEKGKLSLQTSKIYFYFLDEDDYNRLIDDPIHIPKLPEKIYKGLYFSRH